MESNPLEKRAKKSKRSWGKISPLKPSNGASLSQSKPTDAIENNILEQSEEVVGYSWKLSGAISKIIRKCGGT